MSNVPEAPRFGDEDDDLSDMAPPRPKKSRVWLWVLGILGGGGMLLCCGCLGFLYYMFGDYTSDPATVRQRMSAKIVDIQPPARFQPTLYMNIRGVGFQMAIFFLDGNPDKGMLMVMRMPVETNQFGPEQHDQFQEQMNQQLKTQGRQIDFKAEETVTKKYTIRGKECDFVFAKGTGQGKPMRQIMGVFPAASGTVMLMVIMPEEDYDEAEIDTMIKSIK